MTCTRTYIIDVYSIPQRIEQRILGKEQPSELGLIFQETTGRSLTGFVGRCVSHQVSLGRSSCLLPLLVLCNRDDWCPVSETQFAISYRNDSV